MADHAFFSPAEERAIEGLGRRQYVLPPSRESRTIPLSRIDTKMIEKASEWLDRVLKQPPKAADRKWTAVQGPRHPDVLMLRQGAWRQIVDTEVGLVVTVVQSTNTSEWSDDELKAALERISKIAPDEIQRARIHRGVQTIEGTPILLGLMSIGSETLTFDEMEWRNSVSLMAIGTTVTFSFSKRLTTDPPGNYQSGTPGPVRGRFGNV